MAWIATLIHLSMAEPSGLSNLCDPRSTGLRDFTPNCWSVLLPPGNGGMPQANILISPGCSFVCFFCGEMCSGHGCGFCALNLFWERSILFVHCQIACIWPTKSWKASLCAFFVVVDLTCHLLHSFFCFHALNEALNENVAGEHREKENLNGIF